jgi:hypothetical protein
MLRVPLLVLVNFFDRGRYFVISPITPPAWPNPPKPKQGCKKGVPVSRRRGGEGEGQVPLRSIEYIGYLPPRTKDPARACLARRIVDSQFRKTCAPPGVFVITISNWYFFKLRTASTRLKFTLSLEFVSNSIVPTGWELIESFNWVGT